MTDFSKTVRNVANVFTEGTRTVWGTLQWGGYWGYVPTGPDFAIGKTIANTATVSSVRAAFDFVHYPSIDSMVITTAVAKQVIHPLPAETLTLSDAFAKEYGKILATETVTLSGDMAEEKITDRNGYEFVYGDSSDAEDRSLTAYSSATVNDATWTTAAGVTTIWA